VPHPRRYQHAAACTTTHPAAVQAILRRGLEHADSDMLRKARMNGMPPHTATTPSTMEAPTAIPAAANGETPRSSALPKATDVGRCGGETRTYNENEP